MGTTIGRLTYAYDVAGNRTGRKELNGNRVTWPYDAQSQLFGENRMNRGDTRPWQRLNLQRVLRKIIKQY